MNRATEITNKIHSFLNNPQFVSKYRNNSVSFTRKRKLSFATIVSTILQLAKRSLQIECNLLGDHQMSEPVSKQAFSKARYNINYLAFKTLNDEFLKDAYKDSFDGLWKGYRILGMDGSTLRLPESAENEEYFGRHNSNGFNKRKDPIMARISEIVDLTTGIIVSAEIGSIQESEREIGIEQIKTVISFFRDQGQEKLLFVFDRGYISKEWINYFLEQKVDFIFRVPSNFNKMLEVEKVKEGLIDRVLLFPKHAPLRVITKDLNSEDDCVLVTSNEVISNDEIMKIYWLRWQGCEEGYKRQKISLELENFLGKNVEAIYQEFWATVLTCNLFQLHCLEKEGAWDIDKPPETRINKSVLFGSLKKDFFRTIIGEISALELWEKFSKLADRSKIKIRPNRQYPRIGLKKEKHKYRRVC